MYIKPAYILPVLSLLATDFCNASYADISEEDQLAIFAAYSADQQADAAIPVPVVQPQPVINYADLAGLSEDEQMLMLEAMWGTQAQQDAEAARVRAQQQAQQLLLETNRIREEEVRRQATEENRMRAEEQVRQMQAENALLLQREQARQAAEEQQRQELEAERARTAEAQRLQAAQAEQSRLVRQRWEAEQNRLQAAERQRLAEIERARQAEILRAETAERERQQHIEQALRAEIVRQLAEDQAQAAMGDQLLLSQLPRDVMYCILAQSGNLHAVRLASKVLRDRVDTIKAVYKLPCIHDPVVEGDDNGPTAPPAYNFNYVDNAAYRMARAERHGSYLRQARARAEEQLRLLTIQAERLRLEEQARRQALEEQRYLAQQEYQAQQEREYELRRQEERRRQEENRRQEMKKPQQQANYARR